VTVEPPRPDEPARVTSAGFRPASAAAIPAAMQQIRVRRVS